MDKKAFEEIKKLYGISRKDVLTVGQLSGYIKDKLEKYPKFNNIYVLGEVTNVFRSNNGYLYFDIKDEGGLINCVFFKRLDLKIKNGVEVLILGSVSTYGPRSSYQLKVVSIFPVGEGILGLKIKQLKEKLSKEGLFDEEHKKKIPMLPKSVGLITSRTSSAIKDVYKVVNGRFSGMRIRLVSTSTQGAKAAPEIIKAIDRLNKIEDVDVILLVRGGGSTEDLMCFNDEDLAKAIFKSKKPIVTGVGHETDFTIADFVADRRTPTPSTAARAVVPEKNELIERINSLRDRLQKSYDNVLKERQLKAYKVVLVIILLILFYFVLRYWLW